MVKKLFLAVLAFLLFSAFTVGVGALESGFDREYEEFLSGIPEEVRSYLPKDLFSEDPNTALESAEELASPRSFFVSVLRMIGFYADDMLKMLAALLGIVLLSALSNSLFNSLGRESLRDAFSLCSSAAMALFIMGQQTEAVNSVRLFLERLLAFVNSMLPIMGVLYAAGGNVSTAAVNSSSLGFFIAVTENLCALTLMPAVGICLAFSVISSFGGMPLGEISSTFKRIYTYGIGFLMSIMAIVMSLQNQLAAKADSVGARAAKYAVGSFIPIVGGAVGDSLRTVAASVEYIRSAVGGIAIAIIILLLLPTLLTLFLGRAALGISASVSRMLGCEREGRFLSEIGNVYGYMMAVSSICSVLFIYALTLFVRCTAAAGG